MVSHFKALIWGTLEVRVKQATAGTSFNTVTLSQIIFLTGVPKKSTLISITTVSAVLAALKKQPAVTGQLRLFPNAFMPVTSQGMESTMYQQSGIFEGDTVKGWRAERQKFSIPGHCSDTLIQVIQSSQEFPSSVYTSQPQQTSSSSLWPLRWLSGQTEPTQYIYVWPHGGISSLSFCHTFHFCPTQPFPVITYLFQCQKTECRGTSTAAYLAGNTAPRRLCSIALTPTEERGDTDFHSCSLIKLFCCKHITQFQKGMTKARLLCEIKRGGGGGEDMRKKVKPHKHNYATSNEN